MKYYRSMLTGKIFLENAVPRFDEIYGKGYFQNEVLGKALEEIEPPIISDCIRNSSDFVAVYRYKELHPECSLKEAKKVVSLIKKDLRHLKKKKTSKEAE